MQEDMIAKAFRYMVDKSGKKMAEISAQTKIGKSTLYAMQNKNSNQADILLLKKLADYFGEDISIFCGVEDYKPPIKLDERERVIISIFRSMNEQGRAQMYSQAMDLGELSKYKKKG